MVEQIFEELERLIIENNGQEEIQKQAEDFNDKRKYRWCIRLNKSEFRRLDEVSKNLRVSKSDLGRNLLFYKARIPKLNAEQRQLMMDIANLRSSFSRISNYMKYDSDIRLREEIIRVISKVEQIHKKICYDRES